MTSFPYARPNTVAETLELMAGHDGDTHLLAGGTDLIVGLRNGKIPSGLVIDLKRVSDLEPGVESINGSLRIGATTPMTDLIADERIMRHFPALVESMAVVGSVAIRNRATLAGNICNASPAADTAPAMLVYGAEVDILGPSGRRRVRLEEFFVGPGQTVLEPAEIVASITLPVPEGTPGTAFRRLTRRRGVDLATASLCCLVDSTGATSFAFGAVGPRPFLVHDQTGVLADRSAPEADRRAALRELTGQAKPITDVRSSAEYRRAMLDVLGWRALEEAIDRLEAA